MQKDKKLLLIQLNEINFSYFKNFIFENNYENLKKIYNLNYFETYSEKDYENLEPWIQWFSAVSGLDAKSHKLFRLGDVEDSDIEQIYEIVEKKGYKVGAISPMNVKNKLVNPVFFIPDPWTNTKTDSSFWNKKIYSAIKQAVNDNAENRISLKNLFILTISFLKFFRFKNIYLYLKLLVSSKKKPWNKSLFLDLFLHDIHMSLIKKDLNFSSIFLNAGAHIQHHYFYNMVNKNIKNPHWYVSKKLNPAKELFDVYDKIIGNYLKIYKENIIIATGLSQELSDRPVFYYRLKNHQNFIKKIGINFQEILPRMSRDFLIKFNSEVDTIEAAKKISSLEDQFGNKLFEQVDNRGRSLFVSLTYPYEINEKTLVVKENVKFEFKEHVAFVALKNGIHSEKGYLFTSENILSKNTPSFHIKKIFEIINKYFL